MKSKIDEARNFAIKNHTETNHLFEGKPYEFHLQRVVNVAKRFIHLIPEKHKTNVLCACWLYDLIKNCRVRYTDICSKFGVEIAEIVFTAMPLHSKDEYDNYDLRQLSDLRGNHQSVFLWITTLIESNEYLIEFVPNYNTQSKYYYGITPVIFNFWHGYKIDKMIEYLMELDKKIQINEASISKR